MRVWNELACAKRRRIISIVHGLALGAALAWSGQAAAEDENTRIDGLDATVRGMLYNSSTSVVARLDLPQLGHDQLIQTIHGMFDPGQYAIFVSATQDFSTVLDAYLKPSAAASGLATLGYTTMTFVFELAQGGIPYAALPVQLDDTGFTMAKTPIETALGAGGFKAEVTHPDNAYVLIGPPGSGTAVPPPHSQAVEDAVLLGLQQPAGTPAISFVSPLDDGLKAQIAAGGATSPELAAAIGQADYIGGYVIVGARPEIHLYVRYSGDDKANSVKALYDAAWQKQIAAADKSDQDNAVAMIKELRYIGDGEMARRLVAAMPLTVFNGIVKLDLTTVALQQITGAFVDRFYRKLAN